MRVYIVRHGKAADVDAAPVSQRRSHDADHLGEDFSRELTGRGVSQAKFLAAKLKSPDRKIRKIVTSRYPRAIQTAHVIQPALGCSVTSDVRLEVDHDVSEALAIIQASGGAEDKAIMLVGHNPQLGELISVLCSGLPPQELMLKTGELVAIDVRPTQLVGSGKIVERLRLSEDAPADDTFAGNPIDVTAAMRK